LRKNNILFSDYMIGFGKENSKTLLQMFKLIEISTVGE
jgi:hypothetical protein